LDRKERENVIIAVLPAFNAEKTLENTLLKIPSGIVDEIILVDDASTDGTVPLARGLGLTVFCHEKNRGYGANQKSCYRMALDRRADIIVMIHPDNQYDSSLTPFLTGFVEKGVCDVMLGCRIRTRVESLAGGMPPYKYFFNRVLTMMENFILGQNLGETHSGFRAYGRKVLETIPWEKNSDDFVFDQQFLIQAVHFGFRLGDIPVPTRYEKLSSSIGFRRSVIYGLATLWTLIRFKLHQWRMFRCALFEPRSSFLEISK
jgi:glycosyltransferase involved in cell wall biosynthesis